MKTRNLLNLLLLLIVFVLISFTIQTIKNKQSAEYCSANYQTQ